MNTFLGIVVGIVGLGFLILVHELGHFMVAKVTGMRVEEFSLGFGPYLVKKRWGETVYGISAFPLGGYVRVTGMHKEEFDERVADLREREAEESEVRSMKKRRPRDPEDALAGKRALTADEIASTPLERRYYSHPLWHKLLFIVAGVAMNMIVAFVILYTVGVTQGEYVTSTVVSNVTVGSGADKGGIQAGDRIVSIAGHKTGTWEELTLQIIPRANEKVTVVVERAGKVISLSGVEIGKSDKGFGFLGVGEPGSEHKHIGLLGGFGYAGRMTGDTVSLIFKGIGWMFSGRVPVTGSQGLAGPIGIVQMSKEYVQEGAAVYFGFLALISINLGLLNLLPLLPLDGGHFVYAIVERIRGRAISLKVFERVSLAGLSLFVLLFIVAMYNDVGRLFTGF